MRSDDMRGGMWYGPLRITEALPAPGGWCRPSAQPSGSSRPVPSTGRAELSGFGNARYVI